MTKDRSESSEGGKKDLDFGSLLKIDSIGFGDELDMGHEQEVSKAI